MIEGGIKDSQTDRLGGARTFAVATGVHVRSGELFLPGGFRATAMIVKGCHILAVIIAMWIVQRGEDMMDMLPVIVPFCVVIAGILASLGMILYPRVFDRERMLRLFGVHEALTYFLFPILLAGWLGWDIALLLIVGPLVWYAGFNRILYGTAARPDV
jgi:hypothetical protein